MGRRVQKKLEVPKQTTKEKLKSIKKEKKLKLKQRRARLVIRNLPFQATEQNLREHFEKFGELEDVKVLKKEDGKLVGCGFVQYKLVQKAAKARHHLNNKPFLGRDIIVNFALAKDKYDTEKNVKIKEEDEVEIKEEPIDVDESQEIIEEIKSEDEAEEVKSEDETEEIKSEDESEQDDHKNETVEEATESGDDQEDSGSDEKDELSEQEEDEVEIEPTKKPRFQSNDVVEGRTIFIKNVPFSATNDDLKECMMQFGPIYYALVCFDRYTEHSKGTAFVKFVNTEDAEKALSAGTELTLLGNVLDCHKALGRDEMRQKTTGKDQEKTVKKDSRNLYLVKEGVILAGGKSAEGVSASDMAKRLQLEQYKTQMLRNLNMFMSPERLVIHNLPATWDDRKLRALIQNNSPKNSIIREARIMRDLKNVDASGLGKSKEFGFVAFARHDDALATLRSLNNNPNVFSAHKRPIVTFSIENRSMIKAKQKRLEKSKLKNPKCKYFDPAVVKTDKEKKQRLETTANTGREKNVGVAAKPGAQKISRHNFKSRGKLQPETAGNSERENNFVGVAAKPGVQKMRSRYNLKTQAKLHHESLKKEKKRNKLAKKSLRERKQEFTKQPKQKINKNKKGDDQFSKLVSDYKKKLMSAPEVKKTKWYE